MFKHATQLNLFSTKLTFSTLIWSNLEENASLNGCRTFQILIQRSNQQPLSCHFTFRPRHYLHSTHKSHCKSCIAIKRTRKHATVCRTLGDGHGHLRVVEQWVMTLSCCWVKNLLPYIWLAVTIWLSLEAPPLSKLLNQMTWRRNLSVSVICYNH